MDVKKRPELETLMDDFYGDDAQKSTQARNELLDYGEKLIKAGQLDDYQDLITACASVISEKGIDITKVEKTVSGTRAVEKSEVPAPIKLMRDFEEQAKAELGSLTTGAKQVTQTREIVEKLATTLSRQREIIEKVQKEPSSVERFITAIDKNNELTQKQIDIENDRLKHFREYFPDDPAKSTINPTGSSYKDSQYDKVHRADMQVQLLEDLETTFEELKKNDDERAKFIQQLANGDPDAQKNIDACDAKETELEGRILKVGADGKETGIIQRLKDYDISPTNLAELLKIKNTRAYSTRKGYVGNVLTNVKQERMFVYAEMAETVRDTIVSKGIADKSDSRMASKMPDILKDCDILINPTAYKDEEIKKAMENVKGYVEYVKNDIQRTQDRVDEYEAAMQFRTEAKDEVKGIQEEKKNARDEADRLRNTEPTDAEKEAWLNKTDSSGVVAKDRIEREAQSEARAAYPNKGKNAFTRWVRNLLFPLRYGHTRQTMIAERAESLIDTKTSDYIADERRQQISEVEKEVQNADSKLTIIEKISKEARNDVAIHSTAHNAAASITEQNILSGSNNPNVDRAETVVAKDLSDMGYDIALQKWRNGEMTQADFDRILKEHINNPDNRDKYAEPDEKKGYTKRPEYRNPDERS